MVGADTLLLAIYDAQHRRDQLEAVNQRAWMKIAARAHRRRKE